jgi:CubicO group peptidase (beta-lactamase class C family)
MERNRKVKKFSKNAFLIRRHFFCLYRILVRLRHIRKSGWIQMMEKKISNYLSRITPFGFSGSVLVAHGNEILHSAGYGLANREKQIHNDPSTYHDIGSITKQFTAAGILKLEMEGKLSTDDTIELFLDEVTTDKKVITLHQLLTHTSGIRDGEFDDYDLVTKDEALSRILAAPLQEAGHFIYSNDGYTLLAAIIENVSGENYETYIHRTLFLPANMHNTGYTIPSFKKERIAIGYFNEQDCGIPTEKNYPYWNLIGNGGMLSTTSDLFNWHCALNEDHILSKQAKQKLFTPCLRDYAYGWKVYTSPFGKIIEHGGASSYGTSAIFRRLIDREMVIIVLTNQFSESNNQMAKIVTDKLSKLLVGEEVCQPPLISICEEQSFGAFTEETYQYQLSTGGHFTLSKKEGKLLLSTFDQDCIQLCIGNDEQKEYLNHITDLSSAITNDILKDNFQPLKLRMEDHQVYTQRKPIIASYLKKVGKLKSLQHMGSQPSSIFPETFEVRFHLCGEEMDVYLLYFWKNDQIHFLGFSGPLGPMKIEFKRTEEEYIGYSIEYESTVTFSLSEEGAEQLMFHQPLISAKRIRN